MSLILRAINQHHRVLVATVRHLLTAETRTLLDSMMQQQAVEAGAVPGKTSAYRLTALKKLSQSTKPATVKARVADLDANTDGIVSSWDDVLRFIAHH